MTQIAQTILEQLGGRKFLAMTGATSLASGGNQLSFRLPRTQTKNNIMGMLVELAGDDTYTLRAFTTFGTVFDGNYRVEIIDERTGIYCDVLQEVFTRMTGLATNL